MCRENLIILKNCLLSSHGLKPRGFSCSLLDNSDSKFPVDIKHINNSFELNITDDDKKKLMILSASLIG